MWIWTFACCLTLEGKYLAAGPILLTTTGHDSSPPQNADPGIRANGNLGYPGAGYSESEPKAITAQQDARKADRTSNSAKGNGTKTIILPSIPLRSAQQPSTSALRIREASDRFLEGTACTMKGLSRPLGS